MDLELTGQQIFEFLSHHGYWILVPLMIIEGPVSTIIAATLAALGAFNIYVVLILSIASDMVSDVVLYWIGNKWGMGFVRKVGKYIGLTEKLVFKIRGYFGRHGKKTVLFAKATTGLCWATFIVAGIAKMKFKHFFQYAFMGGVVWSSFLVAMGYFYGYLWREIKQYISWIGWIIAGVAIISFVLITLFKKYEARKIFKGEILSNDK